MTVSTSKSCCSYNYKSAVKGWTGHAPHWFKLGTSAEILVYLGFDYSLSHQTASSLSKCQIINISRENLGDMASPKAFLEKPYQLNPTCEMIWKSAQFYWTRLTGSLFFFCPYRKIIWSFFTWALCPWLSIIFCSKIKGDLWWDGQFIPVWQVGYRQGCSSLKLPSNCQRRFLINHMERSRKPLSWQSRR